MGVVVKYRSMGDMLFSDSGDIMIDRDCRPQHQVKASKFQPRAKAAWLDHRTQEDRIGHHYQSAGGKRSADADHQDDDDDLRRMVPLLAAVGWQSCHLLDEAADSDKPAADVSHGNKWSSDWSAHNSEVTRGSTDLCDSRGLKLADGPAKSAKLWVSSSALEKRRRRQLPMRKLRLAHAKLQQKRPASSIEPVAAAAAGKTAEPGASPNGRETMTLAGSQRKLDSELAGDCRYGTPMGSQANGINATQPQAWDATDCRAAGRQQWRSPAEVDRDGAGPGHGIVELLSVVGIQGQAGGCLPSEGQQPATEPQQRAASSTVELAHRQQAPADRCNGAQAAALGLGLGSREPDSDNKHHHSARTADLQASALQNKPKQQVDTGQLATKINGTKVSDTRQSGSDVEQATTTTTRSYRPMGSCCDSVLQLANQARAKSGCYKVAQQQRQELASTLAPETLAPTALESEANASMEPEARLASQSYCGLAARQERRLATRHSRAGRSPISLQRLTNNRLAKHKLKIQQQRQEQLARLTLQTDPRQATVDQLGRLVGATQDIRVRNNLAERQPPGENPNLNCQSGRPSSSANPHQRTDTYIQIEEQPLEARDYTSERQPAEGPRSSPIKFLASLVGRISSQVRGGQVGAVARGRAQRLVGQASQASIRDDIQPASSSRGLVGAGFSGIIGISSQESGTRNALSPPRRERRFTCVSRDTGNVLAYNSINMLRSSDSSPSSFMAHDGAANNGRHRSRDNHHLPPQAREQADDYFNCNFDSQTIDSTISSASSTISLNKPFCKVCHMGNLKDGDKLISPCKCSGTMQYIHCGCLLKWLEISNRSNEKPMSCELCGHEYVWHKRFNFKSIQFPKCSIKDMLLHLMFVLAISIMLFSAVAPMIRRRSQELDQTALFAGPSGPSLVAAPSQQPMVPGRDPNQGAGHQSHQAYPFSQASRTKHHSGGSPTGHLAHDEKLMLICAASFFMSFFLAIYVQTKARDTLYGLLVKFMSMNRTYYITEYEHDQHNQQQQASQTSNQQASNNNGICAGGTTSNNLKRSSDHNDRQSSTRSFGSRFADIKGLVMQKH